MRKLISVILLTLLWPALATSAAQQQTREAFQDLLEESGLRIEPRPGYVEVPVQASSLLPYEHALRHESGALELRFIVRPLQRITIEYNDPHNAMPEPNHLFPLLFESITNQLAVGSHTPSSVFSETEAQQNFNAHWAAVSVFDIDPDYSGGYRNGLLVALHKNELADAYALFLFNDYRFVKPLIDESLSVLSFAPVTTP